MRKDCFLPDRVLPQSVGRTVTFKSVGNPYFSTSLTIAVLISFETCSKTSVFLRRRRSAAGLGRVARTRRRDGDRSGVTHSTTNFWLYESRRDTLNNQQPLRPARRRERPEATTIGRTTGDDGDAKEVNEDNLNWGGTEEGRNPPPCSSRRSISLHGRVLASRQASCECVGEPPGELRVLCKVYQVSPFKIIHFITITL